jgi:hypothetical protein
VLVYFRCWGCFGSISFLITIEDVGAVLALLVFDND